MWTIRELKTKAWELIKNYYWKAFLVSLVLGIAGGGNRFGYNFGGSGSGLDSSSDSGLSTGIIILIVLFALFIFLIVLAFRIFLGFALEVGGKKYFVAAQQDHEDMNLLGFAFNKSRYWDIVKTMFMRGLFNFLWFLLLYIPGIIMLYAYKMVPYILGDNPNIGYKRAIQLSKEMTKGHKFHMFLFDVSFWGWYILGMLALFIGILFILPYVNAGKAELYLKLRKIALDAGICSYEELMLEIPET